MVLAHVIVAAAWLVGWVLLFRVPRLPRCGYSGRAPETIAIVIPARNEARVLPGLLGDLAAHRPAGARVFVVDDASEDETALVASHYAFVEVSQAPPLEAGWLGKSRACQAGADRAPPGRLVFLDADVRLHGDALGKALEVHAQRGGLVTVWPRHEVKRPYEHASALPNLLALMGVGCGSLVPPRRTLGGFGPFMVTSTREYERAGGHSAVRGEVVEDFALARRFAQGGLPVTNYGGHRDVTFRMYPEGLGAVVDGWTKNFALGAAGSPVRTLLIGFWLVCSVGVFTWAGGPPKLPATVLVALFVVQFWTMFRQVGSFGLLDALLYPVHVFFFAYVFVRSLVHTFLLRRVVWRGRVVETRGR